MTTIETYILLGGNSSRFGSDKALAKIEQMTLAERACETVRTALPESPVRFVGQGCESVSREALRMGVPILPDLIEGRGPVGGLYTALTAAGSDWIFLFACDLPLMSGKFISHLFEECGDEVDVVLPRQPDERFQPLCAFYNVHRVLPAVRSLIDKRPEAAMMTVIDELKARIVRHDQVAGASPDIWANVNRTGDLAEIARKLSHGKTIQ